MEIHEISEEMDTFLENMFENVAKMSGRRPPVKPPSAFVDGRDQGRVPETEGSFGARPATWMGTHGKEKKSR